MIAAALLLLAQEPPPYIQHFEEADWLAQLTYAVGACPNFEYEASEEALAEEMHAFNRRAIMAGTAGAMLSASFQQSLSDERERYEVMLSAPPQGTSQHEAEQIVQDGVDFLYERCERLSTTYPRVLWNTDQAASATVAPTP